MQKFKVLSSRKQRKADKSVRALFPQSLYERMLDAFSRSDTICREGYAVAQCGYRADTTRKKWDYLVRSLHVPSRDDLFEQSSITVTPRAEFLEAILSEAFEKNNAIMELHTHVGSSEPNFSSIDIEGGLENGRFLKSCGLRFAMAVVGSGGFSLCEYDADHDALQTPESARISVIRRNGVRDVLTHRSGTSCEIWPKAGLESVRVAIAGLGGIGMDIAHMLARQGVKNFVLFDDGVVDKTSLDIGAYASEVGKKKTKAAHNMLKKISRDIEVSHFADLGRSGKNAFKECDVLFGCGVDADLKAVLTDASLRYFIPCIEARALKKNGSEGLYGNVRVLVPSVTACSACFDREEPMTAAGPSCVMVNGVVASLAVQEFLDMMAEDCLEKHYDCIEYDPATLAIDRKSSSRDEACPKCGNNGILGAGDERKPRKF